MDMNMHMDLLGGTALMDHNPVFINLPSFSFSLALTLYDEIDCQ